MATILEAGKYAQARGLDPKPAPAQRGRDPRRLQILVPKKGAFANARDTFWRELREGGYFQRYLDAEKRQRDRRARRAAQAMNGKRPNAKSDCKLLCSIPIRDAMRLLQDRPDFFDDDWNLRYLKRKNPDLPIFV